MVRRDISVQHLIQLLQKYEIASGQKINYHKSCLFAPAKCDEARSALLQQWTGFHRKHLPIDYLGVPLFKGRARIVYFQNLITKLKDRVNGWNSKLLSTAGKATLIKSVLSSIHVHTLAVMDVPKGVIAFFITSILSHFFWSARGDHRHHWIAWKSVCKP